MRGGDFSQAWTAALQYARSSQLRDGRWCVRPQPRVFDTGLALALFRKAGPYDARWQAARFFRHLELPREAPLPQTAQHAGLGWEWVLHAGARSLAWEGRARRRRFAADLHARLAHAKNIPGPVAALYLAFCLNRDADRTQTPRSVRKAALQSDWWSLGVRVALEDDPILRSRLLRLQRPDGAWRDDPALTAFLGLVLADAHPLSARRAGHWLASTLHADGGHGPLPETRSDTRLLRDCLLAVDAQDPAAARANRYLAVRVRSESPEERFRSFFSLAQAYVDAPLGAIPLGSQGPSLSDVEQAQNTDGGWGFGPSLPSDAASTADAVLILAKAGRLDVAREGRDWLVRHQRRSGTWRFLPDRIRPEGVRYARPLEGHARCVQAFAAVREAESQKTV